MSQLQKIFKVPLKRTTTHRAGRRVQSRTEKSIKGINVIADEQLVTFVKPEPLDPELNFVKLKSDAEISALFESLISRAKSALKIKTMENGTN